jgi:PIN like domain
MAADPAGLRFFVDESLMGIGKALAYARRDVIHTGHRLIPEAPPGALDTEWMPAVARRNLAVISRDRHIRTRPGELAVLRAHGLRVFHLAGKRDLTNWGYLVRLVRRWMDIEEVLQNRGPGPWFIAVHDSRIVEVR